MSPETQKVLLDVATVTLSCHDRVERLEKLVGWLMLGNLAWTLLGAAYLLLKVLL